MKGNILKSWQECIIIYMMLIMAGNPTIMLYKSPVYTAYKISFLIVVIVLLLKYKDIWARIKLNKVKLFVIFIGLITFSVIINADKAGISTLISYYIFILLGMLISELVPPKSFQVRFEQVMLVVCVVSLFFFGLLMIKPEVLNKLFWTTVHVNEMNAYRSNIFYNAIMNKIYTTADWSVVSLLNRNCGPFWEPGVFQCFISMGLVCLIENRKEEKYFYVKLAFFLITHISTVSIAGMVSLIIIAVWYTMKNIKLFVPYIVLILLGGMVVGLSMFDNLFNRISDILSMHTLAYRIGVLVLTFENVMKSMLWGQAFIEGGYNGYILLFLRFGIIFLILWFYQLYKGSKAVAGGMFFVAVVLGLTSEPIAYSTIFWLIIFYSVDFAGRKKEGRLLCGIEKSV